MELIQLVETIKQVDSWIDHELEQIKKAEELHNLGIYTKETKDREINSHKLRLSNLTRLKDVYESQLGKYKLED